MNGGPGGARTPNPWFRRPMLYPIELRGRIRVDDAMAVAILTHSYAGRKVLRKFGVGNGNRTRNRRSHSPVLCQLSYSHHREFIIATVELAVYEGRRALYVIALASGSAGYSAGLRPGLNGRGGHRHMVILLAATYAYVFESEGAQTG